MEAILGVLKGNNGEAAEQPVAPSSEPAREAEA
jgi:hypothetical protein